MTGPRRSRPLGHRRCQQPRQRRQERGRSEPTDKETGRSRELTEHTIGCKQAGCKSIGLAFVCVLLEAGKETNLNGDFKVMIVALAWFNMDQI